MKTYKEIYNECLSITDGLGKNIDKMILHAVTSFNVCGFQTSGSCQGHLNWGYPFPWIDIDHKGDCKKTMDSLLNDFYNDRYSIGKVNSNNLHLRTTPIGIYGNYRVQHYYPIRNKGVKDKELLILLRKEMNDFAYYLLEIYRIKK